VDFVAPLDRGSTTPLYEQVADQIRRHIDRGDLAPGSRLPGQVPLSSAYSISATTAAKVLRTLVNDGYVIIRDGRSYVAAPDSEPVDVITAKTVTAMAAKVRQLNRRMLALETLVHQHVDQQSRHPGRTE
jgi:DNA-binding GntR family transcriptional regulator